MEGLAANPTARPGVLFRAVAAMLSRMLPRASARLDRGARGSLVSTPTDSLLRYKTMVEVATAQAKIGVWECDLANNTLAWSEGVYDLFELPPHRPVTRAWAVTAYDPASRVEMERLRDRALREGQGFSLDARITTAKGNKRWMRLTANVAYENGVAVRLFGTKQDITEERAHLERLRILAETDRLTGLANRGVFHARLESPGLPPSALVLVDVDDFKRINDTFGHQAGDVCLEEVAARLRRICGDDGLIARLGGDEFAIVMHPAVTREAIEGHVAALLTALRAEIRWKDHVMEARASIGIAILDEGETYDPQRMIAKADLALYAAKADGRDTARVYVPAPRERPDPSLPAAATAAQFDLFADRSAAA